MINSMTGYGIANGQFNDIAYSVEIKTVNSRYYKARIKLPDIATFVEEDIDKILRTELARGTINYDLQIKYLSPEMLFNIDEAALRSLIKQLSAAVSSEGVQLRIDPSNLLELPGIIRPTLPDEKTTDKIRQFVRDITQKAVDQVKRMRAAEGKALAKDLKNHCDKIKANLDQVRVKAEGAPLEYQKKLKKRIEALLNEKKVQLDEETLSREIAYFADKIDISEELTRLDSHLQQFKQSCEQNGQAGRRLDFISQEMLREANTIASKASDVDIIHLVVDIKCRVDRIKEQVQNVE